MAQASHASNAFVHEMNEAKADGYESFVPSLENAGAQFEDWQNQTFQGFGTVLVLGVTKDQMHTAVDVAKQLGFAANEVTDPTYPAHLGTEAVDIINKMSPTAMLDHAIESADALLDGRPVSPWTAPCIPAGDKTVTFRMEDTCSYVFGDKNDPMLAAVVGNFKLHA